MLFFFNYNLYGASAVVGAGDSLRRAGGETGDGGEWIRPELDTRQRRPSVEELKADIWNEIRNPPPKPIKPKLPTKAPSVAQPKELFSDDELVLAWWLMRN